MVRVLIVIILFFIGWNDIKKMEIPNKLNLLLLIMAIIVKGRSIEIIENSILGMGIYVLPFLIIYGYVSDFMKEDVIGFGDIKLVLAFGYILGYKTFIEVYYFFIGTFILAGIFGIVIGLIKKSWKLRIPFSPFLIAVFLYFWSFSR